MPTDAQVAPGPDFFPGEIAGLIGRIKKSPVRMDGEETRADRFGPQLRRAQLAARRIEAGDINPFALPAGVSANVNEEFFRVARRRRCFRAQVCSAAKEHRERTRNY